MRDHMKAALLIFLVTVCPLLSATGEETKEVPTIVVGALAQPHLINDPAMDLPDLERQLAAQLESRDVPDPRVSSALSQAPTEGFGVVLLMTGLRQATRVKIDGVTQYKVWCIDAELHVNELSSGARLKTFHTYAEGEQRYYDPDAMIKRSVIAEAIGNLAKEFVAAASSGELGEELARVDPSLWASIKHWPIGILVILGSILLAVIFLVFIGLFDSGDAQTCGPWASWDKRLEDAEEIAIETDNHDDAWYEAAAAAKHNEILANAHQTRRRKAKRRTRQNDVEKEYGDIASYAKERYGLDESDTVDKLRKADGREARLLDMAKRLAEEE